MSALREIIAEFVFKANTKDLEKAEKHAESFIDQIKKFGQIAAEAFVAHEVYEFVAGIVETASALERMAVKTGIATDELQALQYAAKQSDIDAASLDGALTKLGKALSEAHGGSKEAAKAFHDHGIAVEDADKKTRSAAEALPEIADAFVKLQNPSDRAALAIKFFGKTGAEMIPLLAQGSAGIRELTDEAKDLGGGLSKEAIEGASELEREAKKLEFALTGLKGQIGLGIMPLLTDLADAGTKVIRKIVEWTKHTKIIQTVTSFLAFRGVAALVTRLGGLGGILTRLMALFYRFIVPVLLLEDLFVFFAGGKSAIGELIDKTFGKGSQEKVRAFVKRVIDDLGKLLKKLNDFVPAQDKIKALTAALIGLAAFKAASLVGEFVTLGAGMGTLGRAAGALAFALGGLYAAWDQLNKLGNETEGLGVFGLIGQMAKSGTLDPAKALKEYQDAKARERAGLAPKGRAANDKSAPTQGVDQPVNTGIPFVDKFFHEHSAGARIAKEFEKNPHKVINFDATAPPQAFTTLPPGSVDNSQTTVSAPINITVPPGTPRQQAASVGQAARQGIRQAVAPLDLSAAQDALVATGG